MSKPLLEVCGARIQTDLIWRSVLISTCCRNIFSITRRMINDTLTLMNTSTTWN